MDTSEEGNVVSMDTDQNTDQGSPSKRVKYNFRTSSVINRLETEKRKTQPRNPKPKLRPPPLSKYRRKTANARERERMQEVNDAFEDLRKVIPQYPAEKGKITKITTLTLALNYIKALREVLGYRNGPELERELSTGSSASSSSSSASPGSSSEDFGENVMSSPSQASGSGLDSEGECFNVS